MTFEQWYTEFYTVYVGLEEVYKRLDIEELKEFPAVAEYATAPCTLHNEKPYAMESRKGTKQQLLEYFNQNYSNMILYYIAKIVVDDRNDLYVLRSCLID